MSEQSSVSTALTGRRATVLLAVAVVLAVLAAAAAVWFGVAWANASGSEDAEYSAERDTVQRVGEGAALNFTNIDHTKPDDYIRTIAGTTTGPLNGELKDPKASKPYRDQIAKSRTSITSKVLDSAVTSMDLRQQSASMIVALNSTAVREGGRPADQTTWVQLELRKTGDGWKVSKPPSGPGSAGVGIGSGP